MLTRKQLIALVATLATAFVSQPTTVFILILLCGLLFAVWRVRRNLFIWRQLGFQRPTFVQATGIAAWRLLAGRKAKQKLEENRALKKNSRFIGTFDVNEATVKLQVVNPSIGEKVLLDNCFSSKKTYQTSERFRNSAAQWTSNHMDEMLLFHVRFLQSELLSQFDQSGSISNISDKLKLCAVDAIADAAFNCNMRVQADANSTTATIFLRLLNERLITPGVVFSDMMRKLNALADRKIGHRLFMNEAERLIHAAIIETVNQRACDPELACHDYLQVCLLAANKDESGAEEGRAGFDCLEFTIRCMSSCCSLLHSILYTLSIRPEVQQRCREEIARFLPQREESCDAYDKLEYLDAVITEVLRVRPLIKNARRYSTRDIRNFDGKYFIPDQSCIDVSVQNVFNSKKLFKKPDLIDPSRFLDSTDAAQKQLVLAGNSEAFCNDTGVRLSTRFLKLALAHLLPDFSFFTTNRTDVTCLEPISAEMGRKVSIKRPFSYSNRRATIFRWLDQSEPNCAAGRESQVSGSNSTELSNNQRSVVIRALIMEQLVDLLGAEAVATIDDAAGFMSYGFDSHLALEFQAMLETLFPHRNLSTTVLFEHSSLEKLVKYLASEESAELGSLDNQDLQISADYKVAIAGLVGSFPKAANGITAYWDLLRTGTDGIEYVPEDRGDLRLLGLPDRPYKAGFVKQPAASFDAQFFNISPLEAKYIDPQQRMILESVWQAIEDSRIPLDTLVSHPTGVIAGLCNYDYGNMVEHSTARNMASLLGCMTCFAAGRVSYHLGLTGATLMVDTACSTSLAAMIMSCDSLLTGRDTYSITASANLILSLELANCPWKDGLLAVDCHCKTFDASADAQIRSEAVTAMVLAGPSYVGAVHGWVRGAMINHDGASGGLTVPNGKSQERLILDALKRGKLNSANLALFECHGTGTSLGDPIECNAICNSLTAATNLKLCTAKSTVGHCEASAGVAGVTKSLLAMQHELIPATLHFEVLNPKITLHNSDKEVVVCSLPVDVTSKLLVSVSSFGASGTNANAMLSRAEPAARESPVGNSAAQPLFTLLPLSCKTVNSLDAMDSLYTEYLAEANTLPMEFCRELYATKSFFKNRLAYVSGSNLDLKHRILSKSQITNSKKHLGFLFTGRVNPSHYVGKQLSASNSDFKRNFEKCTALLRKAAGDDDLFDVNSMDRSDLKNEMICHSLQFAVQYALFEQWLAWGIQPTHILGHSNGECAAAVAAGILKLQDACKIVLSKGKVSMDFQGGRMVAVSASKATLPSLLSTTLGIYSKVDVACENGPEQVVLSGKAEYIDELQQIFALFGYQCIMVHDSIAYHSHHMSVVSKELLSITKEITFHESKVPFYSNLIGKPVTVLGSAYWPTQCRNTVLFNDDINCMLDDGIDTFLEVGPHPVLCALAKSASKHRNNCNATFLPSLNRHQHEGLSMMTSLANLYVMGHNPCFDNLLAQGSESQRAKLHSPMYPFNHKTYWAPMKSAPSTTGVGEVSAIVVHPLLGKTVLDDSSAFSFESQLHPHQEALLYLKDHQVFDNVIFPGAAYCEMFLAAAIHITNFKTVQVENVKFLSALQLSDEHTILQTTIKRTDGEVLKASISSKDNQLWRLHASADLSSEHGVLSFEFQSPKCSSEERYTAQDIYRSYLQVGIQYAKCFQTVQSLSICGKLVSAELENIVSSDKYFLHPALLDGVFHGSAFPMLVGSDENRHSQAHMPVFIASIRFHQQTSSHSKWFVQSLSDSVTDNRFQNETGIFVSNGSKPRCIAQVSGLRAQPVSEAQLKRMLASKTSESIAYHLVFQELAVTDFRPQGLNTAAKRWVVFSLEKRFPLLLRAAGITVDAFAHKANSQWKRGQSHFDWCSAKNYLRLFNSLSNDEVAGVCFLNDSESSKQPMNAVDFTCHENLLQQGQLYAIQAIAGLEFSCPIWTLVSLDCARRTAGSQQQLFHAPTLGFYRTVGCELMSTTPTVVDISSLGSIDSLIKLMIFACNSEMNEKTIVLGDNCVLTERLVKEEQYILERKMPLLLNDNFSLKYDHFNGIFDHESAGIETAQRGGTVAVHVSAMAMDCKHCQTPSVFVGEIRLGNRWTNPTVGLTPQGHISSVVNVKETDLVTKPVFMSHGEVAFVATCFVNMVYDNNNCKQHEDIQAGLLHQWSLVSHEGHTFVPNETLQVFPAAQCNHALKCSTSSTIAFQLPPQSLSSLPSAERDSTGCLVVGGSGGIGLEVVQWLARQGVGNIFITSRSKASPSAQARLQQRCGNGTHVQTDAVESANRKELVKYLGSTASKAKLCSVFHLAAVLDSNTAANLQWKQFHKVYIPKVLGVWYVHLSVNNEHLQHFVMFSSMSALTGGVGESNYAGASSFVDRLMHYRRSVGLRGQTMNWGAWADVGLAANIQSAQIRAMQLSVDQGISAMSSALQQDEPQVMLAKLDVHTLRSMYPTMNNWCEHVRQVHVSASRDLEAGKIQLISAENVRDAVVCALRSALDLPQSQAIDENELFLSMGMDSMMAMDFGTRLQEKVGRFIEITSTMIFENNSVSQLSEYVWKIVMEKQTTQAAVSDSEHCQEQRSTIQPRVSPESITKRLLSEIGSQLEIPLSFQQKRLFNWSKLDTNAHLHTFIISITMSDKLNVRLFNNVLNTYTMSQASFRTKVLTKDGQSSQEIHSGTEGNVGVMLKMCSASQYHIQKGKLGQLSFHHSDCERTHLLWHGQVLLQPAETTLIDVVIVTHHIMCDAFSFGLFASSIDSMYAASVVNYGEVTCRDLSNYIDYSFGQLELMQSNQMKNIVDFWRTEFEGYKQYQYPADKQLEPLRSSRGHMIRFGIGEADTESIRLQCRQNAVTLFAAAFCSQFVLINAWCGERDVTVGTASDNRSADTAAIVGYYATHLAVRCFIDAARFKPSEFAQQVQQRLIQVLKYKEYPFEHILEQIAVHRDFSVTNWFQTVFVMAPPFDFKPTAAEIKAVNFRANDMTEIDQTWHMAECPKSLLARVKYADALYYRKTMQTVVCNYTRILRTFLLVSKIALPQSAGILLPEYQVRNVDQRSQQAEFTTVVENDITAAFCGQCDKLGYHLSKHHKPMHTNFADLTFTGLKKVWYDCFTSLHQYQLMNKTDSLPSVVTLSENSPMAATKLFHVLVVSLLSGHSVRVSTDNKPGRKRSQQLAAIQEKSFVPTRSLNKQYHAKPPNHGENALCITKEGRDTIISSKLLLHAAKMLTCSHIVPLGSKFLGLMPSFSVASESLIYGAFSAIFSGSSSQILIGGNVTQSVSHVDYVLSRISNADAVVGRRPKTLQHLRETTKKFEPNDTIFLGDFVNERITQLFHFGSSCQWQLTRQVTKWTHPNNMGFAIPTANLAVINEQSHVCLPGAPGELCELSPLNPAATYRTGVLARFLPDKSVWYIGKRAMMIEFRSMRIDLSEIECAMLSVKEVQACAVVCIDAQLVGFYVLQAGFRRSLNDTQIHYAVAKRVPLRMHLKHLVRLSALPLTDNGSVDRVLLMSLTPAIDDKKRNSLTQLEAKLLPLWREHFGIESLGVDENALDYFSDEPNNVVCGLALRLYQKIKHELGLKSVMVDQTAILKYPSVQLFAAHLESIQQKPILF